MIVKFRVDASKAQLKLTALGKGFNSREILSRVGDDLLAYVDRQFATEGMGKWPKLRPNTLIHKGHSAPLVDTGGLRKSFTKRVNARYSVTVGSKSPLAGFHQWGTKRHRIESSGRLLRFDTVDGLKFSRSVDHPGNPARPMLPTPSEARSIGIGSVRGSLSKLVKRLPR